MLLLRGRGRNTRLVTVGVITVIGVCVLALGTVTRHTAQTDHHGAMVGTDDNGYRQQFHKLSDMDDPFRIIPRDMIEHGRGSKSTSCSERHSFVYIKMIKCGSTTLASMFRRFGAKRDLSCMLPVGKKIYLGWPYQLRDGYYRPPLTGNYDFLVDHVVYNRTILGKLMPRDTVYLTSLREPFSQFKSMFNYYNLKNIIGFPNDTDPLTEYLYNIDKYEKIYQSQSAAKLRYCIPNNFSMGYNLMSFNLGFPTGFAKGETDRSSDIQFVDKFIDTIDTEFSLVLLTEYMPESLILLRRIMCWKLSDLLHINQNVGEYHYKESEKEHLKNLYKTRSRVDYLLYDNFNRTLWKKINEEGPDFWDEVSHFKQLLDQLRSFCQGDIITSATHGYLSLPQTRWNLEIHIYKNDCEYLGDDFDSLQYLKEIYDTKGGENMRHQNLPPTLFC